MTPEAEGRRRAWRPLAPLVGRIDWSAAAHAAGLATALAIYQLAPAAYLAVAALAAFAVLACWAPGRALLAVPLTLPLFALPRDVGGLAFSVPEVALVLTAGAAILRLIAARLSGRPVPFGIGPTPFDAPIALLLAAALLSLVVSEYLRLSLRELRLVVVEPVLFFYLAVALAPGRSGASRLVAAFLIGALAVALLGLAQFALGVNVTAVDGVRRIQATYSSPNHLGLFLGRALAYLLAALAGAIALTRPAEGATGASPVAALGSPAVRAGGLVAWPTGAFGLALLVVAAALALTFSLGAWLGAAAALLVVAGLLGGRRALGPALVALAALGLVAVAALPPSRVAERLDPTSGTTFLRLQLWQSSLAMLRDHPVLGVGLDNFLYLYQQRYILPEAVADPSLSHPHNWVLHFWLALGLPGLVAWLWLLAAFGRRLARAWPAADPASRALLAGSAGALADLLVHGSLDNSYFLPDLAILFWLGLAVATAAGEQHAATGGERAVVPRSRP